MSTTQWTDDQIREAYWSVAGRPFLWGDREHRIGQAILAERERADRYREALTKIAAFDDEMADTFLKGCGSYARFDEPNSVEVARRALLSERGPQT